MTDHTDFPGAGSRTWRSPRSLVIALGVVAAAVAAGALLLAGPLDRVVAGVVAIVLAAVAVVAGRRRVVGGPRGLLVVGLTGSRIVPWSDVRTLECGRTKRMGSPVLEIDLVDDELIMFGRAELGADPAEVAAALGDWLRQRRSPGSDAR